jgi:hypothetical protein
MSPTSYAPLQYLEVIVGYLVCGIVGMFGIALIWKIANNDINLDHLLSDEDGWASTSRFQLVIFTFVVALSFFLVVVSNVKIRQYEGPAKPAPSQNEQNDQDKSPLPDVPGGVLALLGISASSYLVSRGISNSGNGNGANGNGSKGNGTGAANKAKADGDAKPKADAKPA